MTENELVPTSTYADWGSETIEIDVPAHPDFVATIRSVTRSAAALADLTVSDVEELQIAVDEAAVLLLPLVDSTVTRSLHARVGIAPAKVGVELSTVCRPREEVDTTGMAWIMLTGLDPDVRLTREGDTVSIAMERVRSGSDQ